MSKKTPRDPEKPNHQGEGGGRPPIWTPEKRQAAVDVILARIATSEASVTTICNEDPNLPDVTTFFKWKREDEKIAQDYARAKEDQADLIAETMHDIADNGQNDWMERVGPDGQSQGWQLNGEHIQRSRLRIDTRKWTLGKLKPKKYGDRITQEVTGADGKDLFAGMTDAELDKRLADLLRKTGAIAPVDGEGAASEKA
jgi:hypothetical protein